MAWKTIFANNAQTPEEAKPADAPEETKEAVAQTARDRLRRRKLMGQISADAFPANRLETAAPKRDQAIGEYHEQLRLRCQDILTEFRYQQSLLSDVEETFGAVNLLSEELQKTIRQLRETEARKAGLIESEQSLRKKLMEIDSEKEQVAERYAILESNFNNLQSDKESQKSSLESLSITHEKAVVQGKQVSRKNEELQQKLRETERELKSLQNAHESTTAQLQKAEMERKQLHENTLLEQEEKLKIAESREQLEKELILGKKAMAAIAKKETGAQEKIATLSKEIEKLGAESNELRASLTETEALLHTNKVAYEAKIEGQNGRVRLSEQLLAQAHENLHEMETLRNRYNGAQKQLDVANNEMQHAKSNATEVAGKLADLEQSKQELSSSLRTLEKELGQKEQDAQKQTVQLDAARSKYDTAKERFGKEKSEMIEQINQLRDQLVKESSGRSLAEGALDVARKDRAQLQKTIMNLKEELGSPQEATAVPVRSQATPRAASS